ncbi:MAG TPA: hypothetical protein VNC84_00240 [Gammaproteobacteria bacterium]|nr:hypothetical protein [Gammaproteobacteria bacterium]
MSYIRKMIVLTLLVGVCVGCGQSGALYLPTPTTHALSEGR